MADRIKDIGPADEEIRKELSISNERREDSSVESPPRLVQSDKRTLAPKKKVEVPEEGLKEQLTEIKVHRTTNVFLDAIEDRYPGSKEKILRKLALERKADQ